VTIADPRPLRLGLRENIAQFSLLVGVNAMVGGMIGQERTVLPLLAKDDAGFAVGAILAGVLADLISPTAAISVVAVLTAASGLVVAFRMYETHPPASRGNT
jgi:hypothetical protein